MTADELKRKLRQLKRLEVTIRFKDRGRPAAAALVWDQFFSTRSRAPAGVRYPLSRLLGLQREALRAVFDEYFYHVYYQRYRENGLPLTEVHDPALLALLGLPPHASLDDVKHRFRELAQRYHPDHGGETEQFIALMDTYNRLRRD